MNYRVPASNGSANGSSARPGSRRSWSPAGAVTADIDGYGTLAVNPLVSFKVLFQCKRFSKSVSPSHVRDFRGRMAGRADKGIILTTGAFTAEARREASRDGVPPIELIDGEKLIAMLEQLELGLRPVKTYEVDHAFFKEFDG